DVELAGGASFISDDQLESAMEATGADERTTQAVVDANQQARVDGLRSALALLAVISVIALFFTKRIPTEQPGSVAAVDKPRPGKS
ncbi:MAG: MFS transporter, partial [Actinomycetota bacterium]